MVVVRITAAALTSFVGLLLECDSLYIALVKIIGTERHSKETTDVFPCGYLSVGVSSGYRLDDRV